MTNRILLFAFLSIFAFAATAQEILFDDEVEVSDYSSKTVLLPPSPLSTQVVFVGGHDIVQTTPTYGNPAGRAIAKEWHDFIGFTPDESGESLGWVSVNHEMIYNDDKIGDGGGMTAFRITEASDGTIEVLEQTLEDGRTGHFFNVDFANTVGETGMNCAGISAPDGRIWTAEEWFRSSTGSIYNGSNAYRSIGGAGLGVRDTAEFTINAPEFPLVDGMTIDKYSNFNYMVEIDPKQAKAIRKQYNWGRAGWEGGAITEAGDYVYLGIDATPAPWARFVPDTPHDFTVGKMQVYKHDAPRGEKWIDVPETVETTVGGGLNDFAWSVGATMYNRNEWVTIDNTTGMVYWTETGRDNPAGRWNDELEEGGVFAPHHQANAARQGATGPGDAEYADYYGRVLYYNPETEGVGVTIEGGPWLSESPSEADYPDVHLTNPDGLNVITIDGRTFLMIQEDANGTSNGRTPAGVSNRVCELYLLSTEIFNAGVNDLVRITAVPAGAEITGAIQISDNTILVNSQHPRPDNPFPYNHSLTMAISGFADLVTEDLIDPDFENLKSLAKDVEEFETVKVFPNPTTRDLFLSETTDFAIYSADGRRMKVVRGSDRVNVGDFTPGTYFLQVADKEMVRFIVQ